MGIAQPDWTLGLEDSTGPVNVDGGAFTHAVSRPGIAICGEGYSRNQLIVDRLLQCIPVGGRWPARIS